MSETWVSSLKVTTQRENMHAGVRGIQREALGPSPQPGRQQDEGTGCALAAGPQLSASLSVPAPAGQPGPDATPHPMTQQKVKPDPPLLAGTQCLLFPHPRGVNHSTAADTRRRRRLLAQQAGISHWAIGEEGAENSLSRPRAHVERRGAAGVDGRAVGLRSAWHRYRGHAASQFPERAFRGGGGVGGFQSASLISEPRH
uniref:Uncharacterized protein n=1 Tax=Rangifer tarandus platyrhynchus TaxID=3082113 RepID=A0ACB0F7Y0_RANTA|nr:unnamed protein product [Rangifer tarandus platyrhynchus]